MAVAGYNKANGSGNTDNELRDQIIKHYIDFFIEHKDDTTIRNKIASKYVNNQMSNQYIPLGPFNDANRVLIDYQILRMEGILNQIWIIDKDIIEEIENLGWEKYKNEEDIRRQKLTKIEKETPFLNYEILKKTPLRTNLALAISIATAIGSTLNDFSISESKTLGKWPIIILPIIAIACVLLWHKIYTSKKS